jgi:hypothetical protein
MAIVLVHKPVLRAFMELRIAEISAHWSVGSVKLTPINVRYYDDFEGYNFVTEQTEEVPSPLWAANLADRGRQGGTYRYLNYRRTAPILLITSS